MGKFASESRDHAVSAWGSVPVATRRMLGRGPGQDRLLRNLLAVAIIGPVLFVIFVFLWWWLRLTVAVAVVALVVEYAMLVTAVALLSSALASRDRAPG